MGNSKSAGPRGFAPPPGTKKIKQEQRISGCVSLHPTWFRPRVLGRVDFYLSLESNCPASTHCLLYSLAQPIQGGASDLCFGGYGGKGTLGQSGENNRGQHGGDGRVD